MCLLADSALKQKIHLYIYKVNIRKTISTQKDNYNRTEISSKHCVRRQIVSTCLSNRPEWTWHSYDASIRLPEEEKSIIKTTAFI